MSSKLRSLLSRFRSVESIELAAVVATDGLLIESAARPGVDVDAICAVASNGLAMAESLGREIAKGGAVQTMLEYEEGLVLIEPISSDAMLLLLSTSPDDLGYVRFLVAKHREGMVDALSAI
jgi:predicted regulator of Ras-like GTPase activity (Roadblock/LC7/MglB family)